MGSAIEQAMHEAIAAGQVGLQVAVYRHDDLIVDTSAGETRVGGAAVESDTVFFAASAGKVSTATLLHRMVELGHLRYEQTIASLWPEFAAGGKEAFTVEDAVTHRVGLADVPQSDVAGSWDEVASRLAALPPSIDPTARSAYHPFTWGFIVGEIARRADPTHRDFADLIRDEVHRPLGITDLWHALPSSEHERVATTKGAILRDDPFDFLIDEGHLFNTAAHREHLDPSGAWMAARGGARLWSLYANTGVVDGARYLSEERVRSFLHPRRGDAPLGIMTGPRGVMGRGGLMLGGAVPDHGRVLGFGERTLWHPGAGGTIGFADLDAGFSAVICHNELFDERTPHQHPFAPLVRAIYADMRG
ncbi:serine hydrolase domain-containing protein [Microbacterium sp. RD1]|uniref:serine hydrolase domain-containing protein n=1 Tax=Microbacterium sp. RD1 TaxID=3457313 RepID=UPI003FA5C068